MGKFKEIIDQSIRGKEGLKYNLHSHTQFCDGKNSMEEILKAADNAGFRVWGFTPHAPICVESPCNMNLTAVTMYKDEIRRLQDMFPNILILTGMEVDFLDENHGPSSPEIQEYGLDYVIGSVHFIPNQKGIYYDIDGSPERFKRNLHDVFEDDLEYVVNTFWDQTRRMIQKGGMDIVGHIDKIALNASTVDAEIEERDWYQQRATETINLAIGKGYAIEINTKHWEKWGRFFPHPRYWEEIENKGIFMPVNTDTHYANCVESGRDKALELKKACLSQNISKEKQS